MPERRAVPAAPLTLVALVLALVSGACSSGQAPRAEASPGTSPTPSAATPSTPSTEASSPGPGGAEEPEEPVQPRLPKKLDDDPAGRNAFARYVLDAWVYAVASNDAQPLLDASPRKKPCVGCTELADELKQRRRDGWHVALPPLRPTSVDLEGKRSDPEPVVALVVDIPESDARNDDGSLRGLSPAHRDATFKVRMRYRDGAWELLGFSVAA